MRTENKKLMLRLLFILLIVAIFLIVHNYHCLRLGFSSLPDILNHDRPKKETVVILYGSALCNSCAPGKYIYSIRDRLDVLYVVPEDFTQYDVQNLQNVFMLKGEIIKGNQEVVSLLKKISACKNWKRWECNIQLMRDNSGKIVYKKI